MSYTDFKVGSIATDPGDWTEENSPMNTKAETFTAEVSRRPPNFMSSRERLVAVFAYTNRHSNYTSRRSTYTGRRGAAGLPYYFHT